MSRPGRKKAQKRWNKNGPEGRALLECFISGGFNIDDHDVEDVKLSNDVFSKFETSQLKAAIRRLQQNVYMAGTMEDYTNNQGK